MVNDFLTSAAGKKQTNKGKVQRNLIISRNPMAAFPICGLLDSSLLD
jgi:hypothetical protein